MKTTGKTALCFAALAAISSTSQSQDGQPSGDPQARPAAGPAAKKGWQLRVGSGLLVNPTFLGDDDYQISILPNIQVNYGDLFFASVQDGVGLNLMNRNGWTAGPLVKFDFGRQEDGNGPFRVAGSTGDDLLGLTEVDFTFEAGGFLAYQTRGYSARLGLRHGLNGHESFVADISANKTGMISMLNKRGFYSVGPRLKFGGSDYHKAFFGVDITGSLSSGLNAYNAGGGLTSYGVGGNIVLPLNRKWAVFGFAGYDRIAAEGANSPIVEERGSPNQFSSGLFLSYTF